MLNEKPTSFIPEYTSGKKKNPHLYFCRACVVVVRTPLMVEHGCTGLVLHTEKKLKKVTVLNAFERTCWSLYSALPNFLC